MFKNYEKHFHSQLPLIPSGKYAHLLVLRRTDSYAVFQTDGALNTAIVNAGIEKGKPMARIAIFKRKQTTAERLTGRELLRAHAIIGEECDYNVSFCCTCPDCILYGYAIGDSGAEKSKVYADTAFSISAYDQSHETFTLNAPYEHGTMTKKGETTSRFSEQDHVKPETYFPTVVTLRDPTALGLAYLLNNIRRTKRYGAQTTRTGVVENRIMAIVFADGEIFSNLRLTQAIYDELTKDQEKDIELPALLAWDQVTKATAEATQKLLQNSNVIYEKVEGSQLEEVMIELQKTLEDREKQGAFLKDLDKEMKEYCTRAEIGVKKGKKK
ncbi:type I-D CRISPR-associated protein Cas7/Csc2 [Heliorestis convoluta]|uniref:Type I-D CRISPR-associated protein Cas7/Csc2 n=1 Tax=Heliorestis convoluta TaxID=356322 RepID=A0A5Q2N6J0_9FIRM|nr:type I-D CRISPR-associated protein Cas7/Csc2 [Heliorestis convoluta]QGG48992.1 type I-D CRISPR-associated protein Cas7/Csc2 [Heliorestis convoluta]